MTEKRRQSWENALSEALPVSPFLIGGVVSALFFASFLLTAVLSGVEIVVSASTKSPSRVKHGRRSRFRFSGSRSSVSAATP
ncbi:MAG: hypothetical protein ABJL17_14000 [Parvibaculum sp.]|uniref:hypothetical protein n=1 Tax=Parvibaculum sp. TaxID=2024848 RepID=UPI003264CAF2